MKSIHLTRQKFLQFGGLAAGAMMLQLCAPKALTAAPTAADKNPAPAMGSPAKGDPAHGERFGLYHTEVRPLKSKLLNQEYQISLYTPEDYTSNSNRYPVVYLLDADIFMGTAANMLPLLNWLDGVPPMLIAGIGYNMKNYAEWSTLREVDFKIPEVQADPPNSRADRFLAALKQEIIPFVEQNYRADPAQRILFGYSSSGFFNVYALANEPGLFRTHIAGSPDTELSSLYLPAHDQKLAARDGKNPIDVYLSVGSLEGVFQSTKETYDVLVKHFQDKAYPGLKLVQETYPGENHGSGGAALSFAHGLRMTYPTVK
jgi:uncharacterized protein